MTDRELVTKWWDEGWNDGLWAATWSKSIDGLTPQQAAWSPAPGRTSIWQIVLHMVFWRENALRRMQTGKGPSDDEVARLNFPEITTVSETAWTDAKRRLEETQQRVAATFRDPAADVQRVMYLLPHDCYHIGQINYLRAMQGLKPIE